MATSHQRAVLQMIRDPGQRNSLKNLMAAVGDIPTADARDIEANQMITHNDLSTMLIKRVNNTVPDIITGLLDLSYDSPFTKELLPYKDIADGAGNGISWNVIHFNDELMSQVESEGIGRTLTHNSRSYSSSVVRRAAAIRCNMDFYETPEGVKMFKMQVAQIAATVNRTDEMDVLNELLSCNPGGRIANDQDDTNMIYGAGRNLSREDSMKLCANNFGVVNKTADSRGLGRVVSNLTMAMTRLSVEPDYLVAPPRMLNVYRVNNDDLWNYDKAGKESQANREEGLAFAGQGRKKRFFQGLRVVDAHIDRAVPTVDSSISDHMVDTVQTGEIYYISQLAAYPDHKSMEHYSSRGMSITIENEKDAKFSRISQIRCIENSMRFHRKGRMENLLDENRHLRLVGTEGAERDLFMYTHAAGDLRVCKQWVHMGSTKLRPWGLRRMAMTFLRTTAGLAMAAAGNPVNVGDPFDVTAKFNLLRTYFRLPADGDPGVGAFAFNADMDFACPNTDVGTHFDRVLMEYGIAATEVDLAVVVAAFLASDIRLDTLRDMARDDVAIPLDVELARPWQKYRMGSAIIMKGGEETGNTYRRKPVFRAGESVGDNMLLATYSVYSKAVVRERKNVVVAPNVFCEGYVGGNGIKFLSEETVRDEINQTSGVFASDESLFPMLVPLMEEEVERSWVDLRGYHPEMNDGDHHGSRAWVQALFDIQDADVQDSSYFNPNGTGVPQRANTTLWRGFYQYGPPENMQTSPCCGPLGPITYPGSCRSRQRDVYEPIRAVAM